MRNHVKRFLTLIIITLLVIMAPASAFAVDASNKAEGYEVKNYSLDVQVNKDHTYNVHQILTVNLPANFSEFRSILPSGNFVLSDVLVADYEYTIKSNSRGTELVIPNIGDENATTRVIDIEYTIKEYAENNDASDMFYYDAVSPNWQVPITSLEIALHLPSDFDWSDLQYYAGQFGSQDVSDRLTLNVDGDTVFLTGNKLPANFGITFKAELPNGYWEDTLNNSWTVKFSAILAVGLLLVIGLFWIAGGRDPKFKRRNEMHPIEGLTPADVGYLLYGKMRIKDIVALIVYLAIKGSLRIVEYQPKKYKLVKLEEPKNEERFIRNVYYTLFDEVYDGRAILMEDLGTKLVAISKNVELSIASGYNAKSMKACTTLSKILRFVSIVILSLGVGFTRILADMCVYKEPTLQQPLLLALVTMITLFAINRVFDTRFELEESVFRFLMIVSGAAYAITVGYVANIMAGNSGMPVIGAAIVIVYFAAMIIVLFMKSRAVGNARVANKLYGLRHFMSRATASDIAPLVKENPDYYYELLPYALLFSMAETWARKFKWIKATSPFFYEEEFEGNIISTPSSKKSSDAIARELKTFSRTIESEYHTMIRKRR